MFCKLFRMLCRRTTAYEVIRYSHARIPEENSKCLIELTAQDFEQVRDRTDQQCAIFGRFMSIVLLVERKLERLLSEFDKDIEGRMFGQKINVYRDFLKEVDWSQVDLDVRDFRDLIAPMTEIKKIRDAMAHDLSKVAIRYEELRQTVEYVKRKRHELYENISGCEDEQAKCVGAVSVFGFVFSEQLARLRCALN